MKKYFYFLLSLCFLLISCSTPELSFPEQKGTFCMDVQVKDDSFEKRCYPARLYLDPTRFHRLNDYQKDHMPEMP